MTEYIFDRNKLEEFMNDTNINEEYSPNDLIKLVMNLYNINRNSNLKKFLYVLISDVGNEDDEFFKDILTFVIICLLITKIKNKTNIDDLKTKASELWNKITETDINEINFNNINLILP